MTQSKNKYDKFKGKEVVFILRGQTKLTTRTSDGIIETNNYFGYLVDYDAEHLFMSQESPTDYSTLIKRDEVVLMALAPNENDIEFTPSFSVDDTEIN